MLPRNTRKAGACALGFSFVLRGPEIDIKFLSRYAPKNSSAQLIRFSSGLKKNIIPLVRFRREPNSWLSDLHNRSTKKTGQKPVFFVLVAGPGIEPGSGGYEPPEVPLLYPAMCISERDNNVFSSCWQLYLS